MCLFTSSVCIFFVCVLVDSRVSFFVFELIDYLHVSLRACFVVVAVVVKQSEKGRWGA